MTSLRAASHSAPFKSGDAKYPRFQIWSISVLLFALALSTLPHYANAQLTVLNSDDPLETPVVQLWYDGYWKEVTTYNGTMAHYGRSSVLGKIAVFVNHIAPHEPIIADAQRDGAAAVLIVRVSRGEMAPGGSMYQVDGSDRKRLKIPVFETLVRSSKHALIALPDGTEISMTMQENQYILPAQEKFQIFGNLLHSFMEMAIVTIGLYRLRQFFYFSEGQFIFVSIGPVCIILEIIGALLRLAYTFVDPFFTYRLMPYTASMVLLSISFPFTLSAGILLTFFWAETLTTTSVETSAFITKYRIPALVVVAGVFIVEIVCSTLRTTVQGKLPVSPNYISIGVYLVIALILVIFYVSTAVAVMLRLRRMKNDRAKKAVAVLSIRVAASSSGYVLFAVVWILYMLFAGRPWGVNLTLNGAFLGDNIAGLLQVLAIRPIHPSRKVRKRSSATTSSSDGIKADSAGPLRTLGGQPEASAVLVDTHKTDSTADDSTSTSSSATTDSADSMYQTDVEPTTKQGILVDTDFEEESSTNDSPV